MLRVDFEIYCGIEIEDVIHRLLRDLRKLGFDAQRTVSWDGIYTWISDTANPEIPTWPERCRVALLAIGPSRGTEAQGTQSLPPDHLANAVAYYSALMSIFGPYAILSFDKNIRIPAPFDSFVVQCWDRGNVEIIETLKNRFGSFLADRRGIEERYDALSKIFENELRSTIGPNPLLILVFGPGEPKGSVGNDDLAVRLWVLRKQLVSHFTLPNCIAVLGEDLVPVGSGQAIRDLNPAIKEHLAANPAVAIAILASSIGAAAEVGMVAQYPHLCARTIIALLDEHKSGFLSTGAARECRNFGAKVLYYSREELQSGQLFNSVANEIQSLLEAETKRRLISRRG